MLPSERRNAVTALTLVFIMAVILFALLGGDFFNTINDQSLITSRNQSPILIGDSTTIVYHQDSNNRINGVGSVKYGSTMTQSNVSRYLQSDSLIFEWRYDSMWNSMKARDNVSNSFDSADYVLSPINKTLRRINRSYIPVNTISSSISRFETIFYERDNWAKLCKLGSDFKIRQLLSMYKNKLVKIRTLSGNAVPTIYKPEHIQANIAHELKRLKKGDFGVFDVFDVFNGDSCTHGLKVFDVVATVLRTYITDPAVIQRVNKIPINYFSNIEWGDSVFHKWKAVGNDSEDDYYNSDKLVDSTVLLKFKGNNGQSPLQYLYAIYQTYTDSLPDIISSSYMATCGSPIMELTFTKPNNNTNFFAAGDNEQSMIEDLDKRRVDSKPEYYEPLSSYTGHNDRIGSIVVGNKTSDTSFAGMYSRSGRNVHVLGQGVQWGNISAYRCLNDSDAGTSFATPEVATKLFMAKALWRTKGMLHEISPIEARRRLILATNFRECFWGKFASAGDISMNKLLQTGCGYLVDDRDSVITIDSIIKAYVILEYDSEDHIIEFNSLAKGKIRALYFGDTEIYQFLNDMSEQWTKVPRFKEFFFAGFLKDHPGTHIVNLKKSKSGLKQFVILN